MRFKLNGNIPYMIYDSDDGCFITDNMGYYMEAEQMVEISNKLIKTAKEKGMKKAITDHNSERKNEVEKIMNDHTPRKKEPTKAYIYIMECGGKYKIGVSKDVEKRKKQLDNRPFPVNIIFISPLIEDAYVFEKALHDIYTDRKIDGEWFDLTDDEVKTIKLYLSR